MKSTILAAGTAGKKAIDNIFPPELRLLNDPYSIEFTDPFSRFIINKMKSKWFFNWMNNLGEKIAPGVQTGLICRSRYMDDVTKDAISKGFEVVINLGGGYDTRCLRLEELAKVKYYHIDQFEVIESFRNTMANLPKGVPSNVVFVPIDFNHQSLEEELTKAGYDKKKRTLFIWEGVTQYISEEAIGGTLKYIASSQKGNRVAFSYVLQAYLENPETFPELKNLIKQVNTAGVKWICGLSREGMNDYLDSYGLQLIEDIGTEEYRERYLLPIGRDDDVMAIERIALAEVAE